MPPKKARNPEDESTIISSGVDDFLLPRTVVQRLAKGVLPANTQIGKDALTAIMKSTTVFVNYLASNANDRAVLGNHKTIKPEDVLEALKDTEFEQFIPRVKSEHDTFVQIANDKRNDYRKKLKEDTQAKGDVNPDNTMSAEGHGEAGDSTLSDHSPGVADGKYRSDDEPPAAKRPRMSLGDRQSMTGDSRNQDGVDEEDIDATEPEEPEDEIEEDEEEDFGEPAKAQGEQDDDMDGGVELDDSNAYNRRDADDESEDGY